MPAGEALCIRRLHHDFGRGPVLRGVDIEVQGGELVALVGPNGAGKTTLLRLACALLELQQGEIQLGGTPLAALDRRALATRAAYVPQGFHVDFPFTVREIAAMGRTPYRGRFAPESATDTAAIERALSELDLVDLAGRPVPELSGGERQRVAVARAFAQETPVLLLDEPTASLDLRHAQQLLERIKCRTRAGACALASLHDINLAARFADRIVVLHEGKIDGAGAPRDVLTPERIARVFGVSVQVLTLADGSRQCVGISTT